MEHHAADNRSIRLALPCYDNRVLPRFGAARCFVIADLHRHTRTYPVFGQYRWCPEEDPALPAWLKQQGVAGVLCGGIHPRFQVALEAHGLWVVWGFRGEIPTVLEQWRSAGEPTHTSDIQGGFVSCCRQPARLDPETHATCKRRRKP